ncbi:hypothetical protein PEL8287_00759 [Roseovarius litorisediminis]|uniref:Uncharacterized protein n=1 Tax=Roseovarius litorisediminis TaxID=1312363 RepID=A0A1Y5RNC6_9RHOB|nr:hypothetical protein PEL8287_00759 [Roseovarius litorisediminis]
MKAIGDFYFKDENGAWMLEMLKTHDLRSLDYIRAKWVPTFQYRALTQPITSDTVNTAIAVEIRIDAETRCGATP